MKIFLDTSSLVKLYHEENDTIIIENIFNSFDIEAVFLSKLTKIEFLSTIWKKVRIKQMSATEAKDITKVFELDLLKYNFVPTNNLIVEQSINLIAKYGINGLRTLDSLQLSTAVFLKNEVDLFITSDKLLNEFFKQESLPTHKQVL